MSATIRVEVNPLDVRTVGCTDRCHHTRRGREEAAPFNLGIITPLKVVKQSMSPGEIEAAEETSTNTTQRNVGGSTLSGGRDLMSETAASYQQNNGVSQGGGGCTSGSYGTTHKDWFRVIGPNPTGSGCPDLVCTLWVADQDSCHTWTERCIDIFSNCTTRCCDCTYSIDGARAQIKPCRVFSECLCRGDVIPNWEYGLRGSCFGFRVLDDTCGSKYSMGNYGSITKGKVGIEMGSRL